MSNKDLNYIAGLEKAIKQKYGEEAVQNPSSNWTFSAKLIKKDSKNVCDVCSNILKQQDMLYETKYECCRNCYVQYVEGREDRWKQGWRPDNV
jgi:hypothetical protein